ncbi:MAG TPA: M56 family metallopeptidase [Pyrinomonadaceae bacterium]|nr:M56 family metallopeptidase [Pyrinomonadaceae bacterium]
MNLETLITSRVVTDLGWTLVHSLWQIGLIACLLFIALRLLRSSTANLRYVVSLTALGVAFALPIVTFVQISTASSAASPSGETADSRDGEAALDGETGASDRTRTGNKRATSSVAAAGTTASINELGEYLGRRIPNILPFAVGLWLLGVAIFSLRLTGGIWQLKRFIEREESVDDDWQQMFSNVCGQLGVTAAVRLMRSAVVATPIAVGVLSPIVIVPASLFLQMSPRELETIIAHELIHIRRYDPLVNMLQSLVEVIFFYHPAVWWMSAQIRREREFAADAAVLDVFRDSHTVYASALANLEEIRLMANGQVPSLASAANGGNLMQRIQKILKIKTEASGANSAWTAGLAFLLTSVVVLAILSFNSLSFVNAHTKGNGRKLAIGFVSIPPVDRTDNAPKDADATARLLIEKLKAHKVPATGFLQGGMISDGEKMLPVRANIARLWIDAGLELGLGGFKHIKLFNTPVDEYIANIEKNERVAKKLIGDQGLPPRYFSYPFLNAGKSTDDRAKVEAWLGSRGYTSVKYTFDNQEWVYSHAYDMARNDNDVNTMKEVREAYLRYIDKMFEHYEAYSAEMFGRDIAQTMVLTPSRLITDTADEFFGMALKRGYSFVTIDEAQKDPAYKTAENFAGEAGISWFERWSMAQGKKLRDEPRVDAQVWRTWESRSKK